MPSQTKLTGVASALCILGQTAHAEGVAYFEAGSLFAYALLWLLALLLLAVAAGVSAKKRNGREGFPFVGALVVVFFAPLVVFAIAVQKQDTLNTKALRNADAEAKFCTVDIGDFVAKVDGNSPVAIRVKVREAVSAFPYRSARDPEAARSLDALAVVEGLKSNGLVCHRSRVRAAYVDSSTTPIDLCATEAALPALESTAVEPSVYDVIIGETWRESKYPEPEQWGETRMAQVSIRIAERSTNRNLGMNGSSILLSSPFGRSHSCRHFSRELPETLASVFPA